ncbi:hypothetical protein SSBR45G_50790 [Bradyrhizobium sp. SSBR45G]|nr:hypothetical protein SSBR45G_50790 [Bradyrhizobium sp. SSBR45G]GLH87663.1 hypothetical protein SSBR45R_51230 [Bradyrhizobium sp. SSBR45R]
MQRLGMTGVARQDLLTTQLGVEMLARPQMRDGLIMQLSHAVRRRVAGVLLVVRLVSLDRFSIFAAGHHATLNCDSENTI